MSMKSSATSSSKLDRGGFVFERQIGQAGDERHPGDGVADDVDSRST